MQLKDNAHILYTGKGAASSVPTTRPVTSLPPNSGGIASEGHLRGLPKYSTWNISGQHNDKKWHSAEKIIPRGIICFLTLLLPLLLCVLSLPAQALVWVSMPPMQSVRGQLAAATGPDGKLYAFGGMNGLQATNSVEQYNPYMAQWNYVNPLPVGFAGLSEAVAVTGKDGWIYVIGGSSGNISQNTLYRYNALLNNWETRAPMPGPNGTRSSLAATVDDAGRIYAIGGYNTSGSANPLTLVQWYDPATDTWHSAPSLNFARQGHSAVTDQDGKVYVFGGGANAEEFNANAYNGTTGANWVNNGPLSIQTGSAAAIAPSGQIYSLGGSYPLFTGSNSVNQVTPFWWFTTAPHLNQQPNMLTKRGGLTATTTEGYIIALGGSNSPFVTGLLNVSEAYGPYCAPNFKPSNRFWLRFNEPTYSGVAYSSGSSPAVGTVTGNPNRWLGRVGSSFRFDGATHITVPQASAPPIGTNDLTIEMWVRPDVHANQTGVISLLDNRSLTNGARGYTLFLYRAAVNQPYQLALQLNNGNPAQQADVDYTNYFAPTTTVNSTTQIVGGQWAHLAAVVQRNGANPSVALYVNAVQVAKFTSPTPMYNGVNLTCGPLIIGQHPDWLTHFIGEMDEITIYDSALNWQKILAIFRAGGEGKKPPSIIIDVDLDDTLTYNNLTLNMQFVSLDTPEISERNVTLDEEGKCEISDLPPGQYRVRIKGDRWLARTIEVDTREADATTQVFLDGGDANNDNSVDVLDLDALIQAFDATPGVPGWNAQADLNNDESVDVFDLDILIRNFDRQGE